MLNAFCTIFWSACYPLCRAVSSLRILALRVNRRSQSPVLHALRNLAMGTRGPLCLCAHATLCRPNLHRHCA
uniref:Putative secreted protein n=1 Tax=Anopheles marajoara TaxID=58244 RepID=A0A2M4CE48_9DIPT